MELKNIYSYELLKYRQRQSITSCNRIKCAIGRLPSVLSEIKNFFELHNQFEVMYNDTKIKIDDIAERIVTLKYHPISKLSDYIEVSNVKESSPLLTDVEMVDILKNDHKIILTQLSKVITKANVAEDEGTLDLIGAYIRELEKSSWMLNAWSKNTSDVLDSSFVE